MNAKHPLLKKLEELVESLTGMKADEIRNTPLCELRKKRRWKLAPIKIRAGR